MRRKRRTRSGEHRTGRGRKWGGIREAGLNRVLAGVVAILVLAPVIWYRWWIAMLVAVLVTLFGAISLSRSKKRHPHVHWVRMSLAGGLVASLAVLGPYVAVAVAGSSIEADPRAASQSDLTIPGHFDATLSEMRLLVALFAAATLGAILLAYSLSARRAAEE